MDNIRPIARLYSRGKKRKGTNTPGMVENARIRFVKNNPMHNPEYARKNNEARRGRVITPQNLFKKGNKFHRKTPVSQKEIEGARAIGIANRGRKNPEQAERARIQLVKNNPMHNTEIVKKQHALISHPKIPITFEMEEDIVVKYIIGYSMEELGKQYGIDRQKSIRKILIKNEVAIRKK